MSKESATKVRRLITAWEEHASNASFGGYTLAQFKAKVKPSLDKRDEVAAAARAAQTARDERDNADAESLAACAVVVNGIKADPKHGEDSAFYGALGYVRRSERKSGLKRVLPELKKAA